MQRAAIHHSGDSSGSAEGQDGAVKADLVYAAISGISCQRTHIALAQQVAIDEVQMADTGSVCEAKEALVIAFRTADCESADGVAIAIQKSGKRSDAGANWFPASAIVPGYGGFQSNIIPEYKMGIGSLTHHVQLICIEQHIRVILSSRAQ